MNFGQAIEALEAGHRVRRTGWNGKGMHVYLETDLHVAIGGGIYEGSVREYEPTFVMFTAQGKHQPGWTPQAPDMLGKDWEIVTD